MKKISTEDHIRAFGELGERLKTSGTAMDELIHRTFIHNSWFTEDNIKHAIGELAGNLQVSRLEKWLHPYANLLNRQGNALKRVGLILAGNIPLVGFHDVLCTLISGQKAVIKLSSQDHVLIPALLDWLTEIEPGYASRIVLAERLKDIDAVIATGSDNSARYFLSYFGKYPHIIRKNRHSAAVLDGKENQRDIQELGKDIFLYFGLGCRNVSKIFIPENQDLTFLLKGLSPFQHLIQHHKYANNYEYQLTLLILNKIPHERNHFVLLTENSSYTSPVACIHFEYYQNPDSLRSRLESDSAHIQCIVSRNGWLENSVPFGQSQSPALWDYADNIDTMQFLLSGF